MEKEKRSKFVLYVGYPMEAENAPHQAMAPYWLSKRGIPIRFLTMSESNTDERVLRQPNLRYESLKGRGWRHRCEFLIRALKSAASPACKYIYVQGAQYAIFGCILRVILPSKKVIYHTQDFRPTPHILYRAAERFLSRRASFVICNEVNRSIAMQFIYKLKHRPLTVRTALPSDWLAEEACATGMPQNQKLIQHRKAGNPLIVAGGGMQERRKSATLIEALSLLPDKFAVVFTGYAAFEDIEESYRSAIVNAGLKDRVFLLPRLKYAELLSLFRLGDVGILLYSDEDIANFYQGPGRLTEYLQCGLPMVASNFPGLELLALKHDIGEIADPDSAESVSQAILKVWNRLSRTEAEKDRLQQVAKGPLAYELHAEEVFGERIGLFNEFDVNG